MPRRNSRIRDFERRHTNNDGRRQIRNGKTVKDCRRIARRLNVPFVEGCGWASTAGKRFRRKGR